MVEIWQTIAAEVQSWTTLDIMALIKDHGKWFYLVTFIWTFLEGETFVIFAGAASSQKLLDFKLLVAVAGLGSFAGDQLYFWVGRRWGKELLRRFPRWEPGVQTALNLLERYHVGFILTFRFIYGVRNFSSFAMGLSGVPWVRFAALNLIAATVWALVFAGAGYLLGQAVGHVAENFGFVMLGVFVLVFFILWWVHRRSKQTMMAAQAARQAAAPAVPDTEGRP